MIDAVAVLFGSLGMGEVLVIFAVLLLFFGPRRLPSIARSLGRISERLRRASSEFSRELMDAGRENEQPGCSKPPPAPDERKG